jgi:hypothetical protein
MSSRTTTATRLLLSVALASVAGTALADDDIEGRIESINATERSFVVDGKRIFTTERTDYDDEYMRFEDLRVGHRVEVDVVQRDGRLIAEEIERDED